MAHELCYFEILSTDPEASQALLGPLFGWSFVPSGDDYWMFQAADGPGGGLQRVAEAPAGNAVQVYIHVPSIDDTLERAAELGGLTEQPRTEIGGGHGFYALLRDPGGAVLGLWQPPAA